MVATTRIRSSIACVRCRRSKIKCDNTGRLDTPCENCIKSGNKCTWPLPAPLPSKRPVALASNEQETYTTTNAGRRRPRRRVNSSRPVGHRSESFQVTRRIDRTSWDKVLITYQRHFVTELPFIHIPTLKNRIYDLTTGQNLVASDIHLVLLGLLALTARYHPELAHYAHGVSEEDPIIDIELYRDNPLQQAHDASDAFARALDKALGSFLMATSTGSVERVQALLMLGLYEWISPNHEGLRAWMLIGAAGRMAQALRLGYECKPNPLGHAENEDFIVDSEVRRRTMFSCFIFDRLISCGKERPSFIQAEDFHIRLPCTKEDFDLSRQVNAAFLSGNINQPAAHAKTSLLGRFVQLVDIWGRISHYTNAGGRFLEKEMPPWDRDSRFYHLQRKLEVFDQSLENSGTFFGLNPSNYFRHENNSNTYILLHLLLSLCKIMLHRQYLPFIPINCQRPCGPLDEPTFPPTTVPPGFWEESARQLFKATKTVVDLIELCGDNLPHSPLAAFVIYTASFTGIYARYFPHMDTDDLLTNDGDTRHQLLGPNSASDGSTKILFDALRKLAEYSGVASAFVTRFDEVDHYFLSMIQDHNRNLERRASSLVSCSERVSVRMGGDTGGLEEWVEKSDGMVSNSYIIKEHVTPVTPGKASSGNQGSLAIQADGGMQAIANKNDEMPLEESSLTAFGSVQLTSHIEQSLSDPMDEAFSRSLLQPSPPSSAATQVINGDPLLFSENTDDWSWAFLHDMYLGSVAFDSEDAGPGFPLRTA